VSLLAETYTVRPIGFVRSAIDKPAANCGAGLISVIELDSQQFTADSSIGFADFSHVEIIFLFNRVAPKKVFTGARHSRDRTDWPKTGTFAQRAKDRPNRIGFTTCKMESVDGLRNSVRELDAIDATPVLDIKLYVQEPGPREPARQTAWSREFMASYFQPPK
jgi:tRNA (adenine37-N6)-methyltransferase